MVSPARYSMVSGSTAADASSRRVWVITWSTDLLAIRNSVPTSVTAVDTGCQTAGSAPGSWTNQGRDR